MPLGLLVACLIVAPCFAQDSYALKADQHGSVFRSDAATWDVPLDKSYDELTPEQQSRVRASYDGMPAEDEPPYPVHGEMDLVKNFSLIESKTSATGNFSGAVSVDETGKARAIKIFTSPDASINKAIAYVVMNTPYKPGRCAGKPCAMDFPIHIMFHAK